MMWNLPNPKPTTINPKAARYERGTTSVRSFVDRQVSFVILSGSSSQAISILERVLTMPIKPTTAQIGNLVDIIRHGRLSPDGTRRPVNLVQMKKNIDDLETLSIETRQLIKWEIEAALRRTDNRGANKIFGIKSKDEEARETLSRIYEDLCGRYNFDTNTVGNGVKVGGDMIAGRVYVDVYFSFKNSQSWHTTYAWIQDIKGADPCFKVAIYCNSRDDASLIDTYFSLNNEGKAVALFQQYLERLLAM